MALIDEICAEIRNYFTEDEDRHIGDFTIEGGVLTPPLSLPQTTYIRITGSRYNDGIHTTDERLVDETFHGGVWVMSPPTAFLDLVDEIEEWQTKNGGPNSPAMSPYQSESFGGYSYSKAGASDGSAGVSWKATYKARLKIYRRARL